MGGCTTVNCTNSRRKGIRLFRFPKDVSRRKIWHQNCRRDKWVPTNSSELCEIHFEKSQFEQIRQDGIKKLKPNAIPTLFDVPNPPRLIDTNRKSLYKTITDCSGQVGSENAIDTSQNKSIVSQHKIILESNDIPTIGTNSTIDFGCSNKELSTYSIDLENKEHFKLKESDFVNASTLLKERQQLFLVQKENNILKRRLQLLGVNKASNTFYSKLLEEDKYKLLLLQREKKLLETKLQIVSEMLDDITSDGSN